MRPKHLEFTAIGSYAGTVVIDFDALAPHGLFHIHGPTGAGKSSLLDALCFALYGQVPKPRSTDRLRSDHARGAVEARAQLDFAVQGSDYRIIRTPTQQRPKKSGVGTTTKRATAMLLRREGTAWVPVSENLDEVAKDVLDLVGLNAEQFMQVVVLPQGKFADALRANADEREKLLRTLFHTERFEVYTERLKARADAARLRYVEDERELLHALSRIRNLSATLGLEVEWPSDPAVDEDQLERVTLAAHEADQQQAKQHDLLVAAQKAAYESDVTLQRVRSASEHWQRRVGASAKLAARDAEADEVAQVRDELMRADEVAPLLPLYEHDIEVQGRLSASAAAHDAVRARLHGVAAQLEWNKALAEALRSEDIEVVRSALRTHAAAHQDTLHAARAQQREHTRLADHEQHRSAAAAKLQKVTQQRDDAQLSVADASNAVTQLQFSADQQEQLQAELRVLEQEATGAASAKELKQQVANAQRAFDEAQQVSLDAQRTHLTLLKRRLDAMASELANQLVDGKPCVVCGSPEHPQPAYSDAVLSEAEVEQASAHADRAAAVVAQARLDLDALVTKHQAALASAGSMAGDPEGGKDRLHATRTALQQSVKAHQQLVDQQQRLQTLSEEHQRLVQLTEKGERTIVEIDAAIEAATAELARLREEFGSLDLEQIEAQQAVLDLLPTLVDHYAQAVQQHQHDRREADQSSARLQTALAKAGIADVAALLDDLRFEEQRAMLRERLDEWSNARSAAQAVLDDPAVAAVIEAPPLADAQAAAQTAREQVEALLSSTARLDTLADDLRQTVTNLQQRASALAPLRIERDRLVTLWQLCDGKQSNARRMSLERYVLAAYLEEVADAASLRLQLMSSGRYRLRHSDEVAKRKVASGLGLVVTDAYTGHEREVSSLSGGETFLASLSLALGLADVVQRHAGGVAIEALFVDEGFGSLDPDTLDLAMAELDRLREGGRLVGVISHVGALRERIPVGIEVVKAAEGSTIRVTGVDDMATA